MSKRVLVVSQEPYPIPLTGGRHIMPGEVAEVEVSASLESDIEAGRLTLVEVPRAPEPEAVTAAPRRSRTNDTPDS